MLKHDRVSEPDEARKSIIACRVEELHARILVYLIEMHQYENPWGGVLTFAITVSRSTGRVITSPERQQWMEGRDIQTIKDWVWQYQGVIFCDEDLDLADPLAARPVKKLTAKI